MEFYLNYLEGFFFLRFFIYLFETEREIVRERAQQGEWQAEGEGKAGFLLSREPDAGLNPRMLGS